MVGSRWLSLLCSVMALAPAGVAGRQAASGTLPQAEPQTTPVFRTNANLVLVDVVVRDKGKPVQGLKDTGFHVLEDGQEQKVTVFEEHRATDAIEASKHEDLPPHTFSSAPQYALTSAANVLLLDALNTPVTDQKWARQRMIKYLRTIPPGTRIAVFTLASRMRMVQGFTTDAGTIEKALSGKTAEAQKSTAMEGSFDASMTDMTNFAAAQGSVAERQTALFTADTATFATEERVRITLDALDQLGRYLSTVPGRKNLIWFSGSFPISVGISVIGSENREFSDQITGVDELLARARVAVYPVDARGLMAIDSYIPSLDAVTGAGGPLAGPATTEMHGGSVSAEQTGSEHSTMEQMAQQTGGRAYYNTNTLGSAIEDGSNYYTLGYVPVNRNYDGAFRKVEVRLEEGRYDLSYRRGYQALDPTKPEKSGTPKLSAVTAAMLHGGLPLSQVVFQVRVLSADDPAAQGRQPSPGPAGTMAKGLKGPVRRYMEDYSIDPRNVTATMLADGRRQVELEVTQAVYDGDGKRLNSSDAGLEVDLPAASWERAMASGIRIHQEIDAPAGDVYLRLGVRDASSGRLGTVEIPLLQR
jgi:VWFA-related protein